VINRPSSESFSVVDLQALGLNQIKVESNQVSIGATVTLYQLGDWPEIAQPIKQAINLEGNFNLRQMATIAGQLISANGRSALATAWLSLDARLVWEPGAKETSLGNWLPLRTRQKPGLLITALQYSSVPQLAFAYIARSPADQPIVCAAVARWPSGRTRVALGGYGAAPVMVMDGPEFEGAVEASRDAYSHAGDEWASAEYRQEMAAILTQRCVDSLATQSAERR
jgi:CO/xanthine dehydrogenase FAD-binding subunit